MMEKIIKKMAIEKAINEVSCYPILEQNVALEQYTKMPLGELSALGATFASIAPAIQSISKNSGVGEKLYRMVIPNGFESGKLISAKTGGLLGNIAGDKGKIISRARFFEVNSPASKVASLNPAIMLMAVAISAITQKIDDIQESQQDIIEFLQLKETARIKGNIAIMQEILNEYKYNWDNEKYKTNKHIQVQEIKRDSEQSIIFSREQIERKAIKKYFLHSDGKVKSKIQKLQHEFKDYKLALYQFSFSSFLEVMLLENFDSGYLNGVSEKIRHYATQYHKLYEKCYKQIEEESKSSIQAHILKGVAGINKVLGKTIAKIPKIKDGQIDENLIEASDKVEKQNVKRTEETMSLFDCEHASCVYPFMENIDELNRIYNQPIELVFDDENVYYCLTKEKDSVCS